MENMIAFRILAAAFLCVIAAQSITEIIDGWKEEWLTNAFVGAAKGIVACAIISAVFGVLYLLAGIAFGWVSIRVISQ